MNRTFAIVLAVILAAVGPAQDARPPAPNRPTPRLVPFELRDIGLRRGPLKDRFDLNVRYLQTLEPERYLWAFRKTAGLPAPGQPYGGWEAADCELRGHSIGHYLSACARVIAQTGDPVLATNAAATVADLAACQAKHGNGYLSAFPEEFFDRVDRGERVWAPYYTIHKILLGLLEMHGLAGSAPALDVAKGMAAYFKTRCDRLDDAKMQRMLETEFGGMHEALLNLHAVTGDPAHFDLAQRFVKRKFVDPLAEGQDVLAGLHANTHLPQIAGQARAYELTGDARCRRIVENFWELLQRDHSYATGGSNSGEMWGPPRKLADTLGTSNQEFCTSYNLEKLTRYLLTWTGDVRYADLLERNFYNGLLVSQHPRTGMLIYYLPFQAGHRKEYGTPFDTMTCCYGTGIQEYANLGANVFFHDEETLYVELFAAAAVTWRSARGEVRVTQQTTYPEEAGTHLEVRLEEPAKFTLALRVPGWISGRVAVAVNGSPWPDAAKGMPGSWLRIERTWTTGDTVDLELPRALGLVPMPDDPGLVAVTYGPLVLAGVVDGQRLRAGWPVPVLAGDPSTLGQRLRPHDLIPLVFRVSGQADLPLFLPLHLITEESYGVYWRLAPPGSSAAAAYAEACEAMRRREARQVDRVLIGDADSEKAHDLQGANTQSGPHAAGVWRHAGEGGFFSYRLKVDGGQENVVAVTYWGSDAGGRIFDLLVDGARLTTQTLDRNAPERLFTVEHPLPRSMTDGKPTVVVRFQPVPPGKVAGGVFGLAMLRGVD